MGCCCCPESAPSNDTPSANLADVFIAVSEQNTPKPKTPRFLCCGGKKEVTPLDAEMDQNIVVNLDEEADEVSCSLHLD